MRIFDCESGTSAWGAWRTYLRATEDADVTVAHEDVASEISSPGPHSHFLGFARWNAPADRNRLAVVVEGTGWAIDDRRRVILRAGQGAFWRRGEWSAFGADPDPPTELKRFCRMLTVAAEDLSLDRFLAGKAPAAASTALRVEPEPSLLPTAAMQVFDCGGGSAARERYERFVEEAAEAGALTERGYSAGGGITGGHPWNSDHLAVLVEGDGWAADDRTRETLTEGQGVFWPTGSWFAVGSDSPGKVLSVGAKGLNVDAFLAAGG